MCIWRGATTRKDMRVANAMRVFSGRTVTGPERRTRARSAQKSWYTEASLPAKCAESATGGPHECVWLRLAKRRPQRGHGHRGLVARLPPGCIAVPGRFRFFPPAAAPAGGRVRAPGLERLAFM